MKPRKFAIFLSAVLLPFVASYSQAETYGSGWYQELQLTTGHEDNISRSYKKEDQVSDVITTLSYGGGHSSKIGKSSQLVFSGYVSYRDFREYRDLDNMLVNGGISWVYQPKPGYASSWFDVTSNLTLIKYRNYDAREGLSFDFDASINRRITSSITGHIGYRYDDRFFPNKDKEEKERDAAFDVNGNEVYAGLSSRIRSNVHLFAEYGFRKGDITSITSGVIEPKSDYDARSPDHVFSDCGGLELCTPTWAYRVEADMHKIQAGIAFPIRSLNMDLAARYYDAMSNSGQSYQDWMITMGLIWNF